MNSKILVTGAGGFIGGHLAKRLRAEGNQVKCVDIKPKQDWYQCDSRFDLLNFGNVDLKIKENCLWAAADCDIIYNLAADMGGMGFIETHKADCMLSVLINTHLLMAAKYFGVKRYFYASSACAYPKNKQQSTEAVALKEEHAYPAMSEDGYGWEKLFSERMCRHFREDYGLVTRVARFHNCYGPYGTYKGGREKAPSAICRKVIEAKLNGTKEIEIWGNGEQTRSFMYVDDVVEGINRIMNSEWFDPINLGRHDLISINQLVDLIEEIAGVKLTRVYNLNAPRGVVGRNSDNTLIKKVLGWEPSIPMKEGLEKTYAWIYDQIRANS